ncbi:hypothetical protein GGH12_001930 [Coemansia sp. RSA 1822]|nr:hypothetical protein LPJ76_002780 [Coemansia sp. RSA 638]KAJ2121243.1 hypothetical protein IW147_004408 [Coemansia sp. RSA 720]KAJ2545157.1 hypothetical protein GGF49_000590 [Coemansia sp. RSA 1853]KAJ2564489.1 hypothetical protein GGH12_001930 [Coemansia sp. RSA 1822]
MSQDDIAESFVGWVGTFSSLSKPVAQLADLTDGIALFEICAEIDRQWFKSIRSADIGDNWVLKLNNLKKLYKLVTRYYEEVLGYPAANLGEPNLSAIAKNEDGHELLKLCHLVLTLAVQCERNQVYIGKIMSLGEDDQRCLMVAIESVLAQLGSADPDTEPDSHDAAMDLSQDDDVDPVARLQAELIKSYAEKDELEKSAHDLNVEHKHVQSKYEELLVLNEELKVRMEDLEKSMARADKSGKADFLLRSEIDRLKHELEKADTRNQDTERANSEHAASIASLTRQVSEYSSAKEEAARLRDQLQEYKHAAERLAKSEHVIEKYKKKLEESTDLRRQVRLLEEQLAQAQDHSRQIEDEYRRMSQLRPAVDNYRDEYAHLESRHNLTISELRQAMERLRTLETEHERLTQDKLRDQDLIASLEEAHREMELNGAALSGKSLEAGLAEAIDAEDRPALLAKVARLERELADAKAQSSSNFAASHDIDDIQKRLADETELRKRFEQEAAALAKKLGGAEQSAENAAQAQADLQRATHDLAQSAAENTNLRSELARSEDELNKARASALASEQEASAVREALRRRDGSESADLRKETQSLEGWYAETHKQSTKFKAEVDRLSADNRQLAQDLLHLDTSKREIDAENQRMRQAIERQGAKLAAASQYSQADVDRLQKELVKSREEVHSLQISVKRMKEHCLQLDQKVRQTPSGGNGNAGSQQTDYREALMSLQSQLAEKDQTLNDMRDMLRNQNNMHMLESRTMASAWFNLQRQLERQSGFGHSSGMGSAATTRQGGAPASWLGQQRVTLDMQLNG